MVDKYDCFLQICSQKVVPRQVERTYF